MENPETLEKIYSGYAFDIVERGDKFFQMMVYLPEINMTTRYISAEKLMNIQLEVLNCVCLKTNTI